MRDRASTRIATTPPIYEPDLEHPATVRWAEFARAAVEAGARAVFGFPVTIGDVHLGALNLYRDRPGPLTDDQNADALVAADVAARAILSMQADAAPGALGRELEMNSNYRFVVHQAAGMVGVQLAISVDEALVRLRAHAFRTDRSVSDVAADVTTRRIRFDSEDADR